MNVLRDLVYALDDDQGINQAMYAALCYLVGSMLGSRAREIFCQYVDATEDRYYIKPGTGPACWRDMLSAASQ